jgi:hypothetical protein
MLVDEVAKLIRSGAHCLDERWVKQTARLIVAQLAHVHRLSPRDDYADYFVTTVQQGLRSVNEMRRDEGDGDFGPAR